MSSIIPVYPLNNLFFFVHCSHGDMALSDSSLAKYFREVASPAREASSK